jgi:hypothetical protein
MRLRLPYFDARARLSRFFARRFALRRLARILVLLLPAALAIVVSMSDRASQ